jgi:acyl-CoA reductase-like NAD-dependent aldehyde dehydrogenase
MTLNDVLKAIDHLPLEELDKIQQRIDARRRESMQSFSGEERARRLEDAAAKIREGLSPEELDEMTRAMNGKSISQF